VGGFGLVLAMMFLVSCSGKKPAGVSDLPKGTSAPVLARDTAELAGKAKASNARAEVIVGGMTPDNLPETKPAALVQIEVTGERLDEVVAKALETGKVGVKTEEQVKKLVAENDQLRENDPQRKALRWGGVGLVTVGVVMAGLAIFVFKSVKLVFWSGLVIFTGAGLYTVGYYIPTIRLVMAGLFTVGLVGVGSVGVYYLVLLVRTRSSTFVKVSDWVGAFSELASSIKDWLVTQDPTVARSFLDYMGNKHSEGLKEKLRGVKNGSVMIAALEV
jgi:hypothetical protein